MTGRRSGVATGRAPGAGVTRGDGSASQVAAVTAVAAGLREDLEPQAWVAGPVTHVYHPLRYAWAPHADYLQRYATHRPEVVLVGMNPGPWGMAQTGVPFGDVPSVRDWLGIEAPVRKPVPEHPQRPVEGFACARREGSGRRLWAWAQARFGSPEAFFARFLVVNYCPLCFLEASGRNRTPDKLPAPARTRLFARCDAALAELLGLLRPRLALGIGAFAAARVAEAVAGGTATPGRLLHPSPANPQANRDWAGVVEQQLAALDIALPDPSLGSRP